MNTASATRTIHFRSNGGRYSAIWMSSRGDLYQEYADQAGGATLYYPNISASDTVTMHLTVTSATSSGTVTPASVTYKANGTELSFDTSGACTTTGMTSIFRRDTSGRLVIIGNLGNVVKGPFLLEAIVAMSSTTGTDTIHVSAPVTIVPYNGNDSAHVTIAPGDTKNFTISDKGGSCILKALTYKGGQEVTSGLTYKWEKFSAGAFHVLPVSATAQTITVQEADVDTYQLYRVTVSESGTDLGSDTQGVLDASDPYDIIVSCSLNDGGGGSAVSTNDLSLTDEMPDSAYLEFTCQMVKRGQNTSVGGSQSFTFTVVAGNGLQLWHPTTMTGNKCRVTVADLKTLGAGVGDYEIIAEGTLS